MDSQNKYHISKTYMVNKSCYETYIKYSTYIKKIGITKDTQEWRLKHIRSFLYYLSENNIKFKYIKKCDVYNYLNSLNDLSLKTLEHRSICLRLFLEYLYKHKITKFNGTDVLDNIRCNAEPKILNTYKKEEIIKVINSINISIPDGKRNLCIILIFAELGLRPKDVCNLTLDNINWQNNSINYIQSKTKYQNILPMSNEIRYALLDYLKNERPKSKYNNIFLINGKPATSQKLYVICNKYFKVSKVNTNNKQTGPYAFRHSLGSMLLDHVKSINEISDILGHKNIDETKIYAKIDIKNLRKISLEVPQWKI